MEKELVVVADVPVAEVKFKVPKFPLVPNTLVPKIDVEVPFVNTVVPRFELLAKRLVENEFVVVA